ncbi:MAG TPA: hypothetical protein PK867_30110 [Pirellulales bacterium]|nr:hypothetical protein [Pirellulales bacterium]
MPRPMPSPNGLAGNGLAGNGMGGNGIGPNDVIDIDIPAGAKQAIREAAQAPGAQQWAHPPQFGSANELATAVQRLSIEIATLETKALYGASVSQQLAQKRELMAALQQQVYQAYYGHNRR